MNKISRRDLVLKYIIEQFIKTAQPVGSKSLLKNYDLNYSSATIRNEMHELETMGYIEKTHTSSGRVPSAKGYRYYIDYLRDERLTEESKNKLKIVVANQNSRVNEVLRQSCAILSEMTSLTSIMIGPDRLNQLLNKVELIPIDENNALCIFITGDGHVEHKLYKIPQGVDPADVEKCVDILNDRLKDTPIYGLVEKMLTLAPVLSSYIENYEIIIKVFIDLFKQMNNEKGGVWGTSNLLDQPEYAGDINKLKKMVELVESNNVWKFISNNKKKEKISVQIGVDNELQDVSVVSANINIKGQDGGKIALVGPKRMDYSKVISAMEFLLEQLDLTYGQESEEEDD